jgi:hypothetical protein
MSSLRCQEHWRGHLWPSTRNANNRAKVRVGTTKRSITAIACMSQRHTQKTFAARFECDDMLARSENDPPKGYHPLSPRVDQFCHRARCNRGQDSRACLCSLADIYWQTGRSRFTRRQSMTEAVDFACPRCTSRYKLVRVRAESRLPSRLLHCRVCKEPLAATDGEYALKYFLVENANKRNNFDLRMQDTSKRDKA